MKASATRGCAERTASPSVFKYSRVLIDHNESSKKTKAPNLLALAGALSMLTLLKTASVCLRLGLAGIVSRLLPV